MTMHDEAGLHAHPDGTRVTLTREQMLACREILIACARRREFITLAELFDAMSAQFGGLPVRRLPDTETSDWLVWTYGLLQIVCGDCASRGEPLLPALVRTDSGEVW